VNNNKSYPLVINKIDMTKHRYVSVSGLTAGVLVFWFYLFSSFAYSEPVIVQSAQFNVISQETLVLPDLNNDGIAELGFAYGSIPDDKVYLQVLNGKDLSAIRLISWVNIYVNPTFHIIPDLNGNNVPEMGIFGTRDDGNNAGKAQLFTRDLSNGATAKVFNWPSNWTSAEALVLDDISGDGIVDVALQGRFKVGARPQLVVRDGTDSSSVDTFGYPDLFNEPRFFQHSDVNDDGVPEIATLGRIKRNNKIQIKIADGSDSKNRLKAYNFPDKWSDESWVAVGDKNNDSIEDWALFGTSKLDSRPQLIIKNGKDPKGAIRIFSWSGDLSSTSFHQVPDMNGDGVDEVAVGGVRSNGRFQFQVKDGTDRNVSLANHSLNINVTDVSFHVLSDLTGDGIVEIGFLGLNQSNQYTLIVQNGDGQSGKVIEYTFAAAWTEKPKLDVLTDINADGLNELLIWGNRVDDITMQIWGIPDTDSDSYADTLDAFPADNAEWLDTDGDTIGNNADTDDDGDGLLDINDGYPLISIVGFVDSDMDGIPNDCNSQCNLLGMQADLDDNGNGIPDLEEVPPEVLVAITSPKSLSTVGVSPVTVEGTVSPFNATLVVNGIEVVAQEGVFSVDVTLQEGSNSIEARASFDSLFLTDSITVALDKTPPNVTVDSHDNDQIVYSDMVTITGLINDIVRGSIGVEEANVVVNNITAVVSNRSYAADIELKEGTNIIAVTGTDKVGNINSTQIQLVYEIPDGRNIELVSGQSQVGEIRELLSEDLVIKVVDENQLALEGVSVVYRVVQGDGTLFDNDDKAQRAVIVKTDQDGEASSMYQVGTRVGQQNQKVRAKVVGIDANVVFTASTESAMAAKVTINAGNNQRGSVGQRLASPFVVYVTDEGANPVEGATVKFKVLGGDGYFTDEVREISVSTTSDGFASTEYWLGETLGIDAQRIEAMLESSSDEGLSSKFSATAYIPADPGNTKLSGVVLDTQGNPLAGAKAFIEDTSRQATTDENGYFNITEVPIGPVHLLVEGSTISNSDGEYPTLSFYPIMISGIENTLTQPIYMVKLTETNRALVSSTQGAVVTMEDFPGYKLEIAANSATFPDGSRSGIVSITAVNTNAVPMTPPNGLQPQLAVTIQPSGTLFSPPADITLPNLDGLPPGQQVDMYSYDHDLEEFVSIGLGTVSEDGSLVESNSGVGILKAGWFIVPQPAPPTGNGSASGDGNGGNGGGNGGSGNGNGGEGGGEDSDVGDESDQDVNNPEDCTGACNDENSSDDDPDKPDDESDNEDNDRQDETEDENATDKDPNDPDEAPDKRDDETLPEENTGADPIVMATGELWFTQTDLKIPGRGFDFELTRTYRSRTHFNGRLGYNWVFNYDQELVVYQGDSAQRLPTDVAGLAITWAMPDGRQYVYQPNGDGSYVSPQGIFETLTQQSNGNFTVRKPNGFKLDFDPQGRLISQRDRFNNQMDFDYDIQGRLSVITDTLGRDITFSYRIDSGHIDTVTDFSGRSVRYYYDDNFDLIGARSPIVSGTPNGNDFSNGKFTFFTYSSGFDESDPTLKHANHNMLSATDAYGYTYLVNTFENDPDSFEFDHITVQQYGSAAQKFLLDYQPLNQDVVSPDINTAVQITSMIDRNGNQIEYLHNSGGLLLEERQYTNRDINSDDPDEFVTRHSYNNDGLKINTTLPEGNSIEFTYDENNDLRLMQSNLLSRTAKAGPRGGAQAELVESFSYEPVYNQVRTTTNRRGFTSTYTFDYQHQDNLAAIATELGLTEAAAQILLSANSVDLSGGVEDQISGRIVRIDDPTTNLVNGEIQTIVTERFFNRYGQLIEEVDPEGIATQFTYHPESDPDGDGVQSSSSRTLAEDTGGYLSAIIRDAYLNDRRNRPAPALAIQTSTLYDSVGNVIAETDGRGNTTRYIRNQLNQVVRQVTSEPFEYLADFYYDANNNLVRLSRQNQSTTGPGLSGWVHTLYRYNDLNDKTAEIVMPAAGEQLITLYEYDANQNIVAVQQPEENRIERVYDERDLVYTLTQGAGSQDASTETLHYDNNGNLQRNIDAQDNTGDDELDATRYIYDGYDRLTQVVDAEGNRMVFGYDQNNNKIVEQRFGNSGIAGIDNEILLAQTDMAFDELDRAFRGDDSLLLNGLPQNVGAGLTPDDNLVTQTNLYDANGMRLLITDDNGNQTTYSYDGIDRQTNVIDANGNSTAMVYDNNDNLLSATRTQVNVDELVNNKTITSTAVFDELNRKTLETDALGNTSVNRYDSRNNIIQTTDALGNITLRVYDGINRLLETREYLGVDGTGTSPLDSSNPTNDDGRVSTFYGYDGNSRLVFQGDDNSNATTYTYDALNRKIQDTYADGTQNSYAYDKDHNLVTLTDQNESVFTHNYDGLNRLVSKSVQAAMGLAGSTAWTFSYDGLSRRITATDNNDPSLSSDDSLVEYRYNSLNYLLSETNNGLMATATYDGLGNRATLAYPAGRQLGFSYDAIYNLSQINDQTTDTPSLIASYNYAARRALKRSYVNGTQLSLINEGDAEDTGYDDINRVLSMGHSDIDDNLLAGFEYSYDKVNNRRFEVDQFTQLADVYEYDSIYRLIRAAYRVPANDTNVQAIVNNDNTNATVAAVIASQDESYLFDGVGNWVSKQTLTGTDSNAVGYQINEMNEYQGIGPALQQYDDNGNLTSDSSRNYIYDAYNRLVRVSTLGGNTVASYKYDAFSRRIVKQAGGETVLYVHFGKRVLEERNTFSQLLRQYVYGNGIDEVLQLRNASNQDYFYHSNSLGSVSAMTDASGEVIERYRYNAYGETQVLAANGIDSLSASQIGNSYGFTGRRLDKETGFYYYRARYYSPESGRFIQRDPLGYSDGMGVYTYVGNNPINYIDPLGEARIGYRPLENMPTVIGLRGSSADRDNNVVGHEHIWFDDGSNIGFGDGAGNVDGSGLFTENKSRQDDYTQWVEYDDDIMKKAVKNLGDPGEYSLFWDDNNCQDYVERVVNEYERIKDAKK
jgi:RHS repeat-associated protein